MKQDEFREMLRVTADVGLLDLCLRADDVPFICKDAAGWTAFRQEIARGFDGLAETDIRIVGSARLGFSMRPRKHLQDFTDESDIDVVVVNETLFDWLWIALLVAAYPRLYANRGIGGWDVPGRTELFAGWLTPTAVRMDWSIIGQRGLPVFQFKQKWFDALKLAARYSNKPHNDIQGRLYRTWRHAELYHLHSIAELRQSLENAP
jgi:hypothetical protein